MASANTSQCNKPNSVHTQHCGSLSWWIPSWPYFYWYGDRRPSPDRPSRWVDQLLQDDSKDKYSLEESTVGPDTGVAPQEPLLDSQGKAAVTTRSPASKPSQLEDPSSAPDEGTVVQPDDAAGRPSQRYGLRQRVVPPNRFRQRSSSGRAWSEGRGDVTNLRIAAKLGTFITIYLFMYFPVYYIFIVYTLLIVFPIKSVSYWLCRWCVFLVFEMIKIQSR